MQEDGQSADWRIQLIPYDDRWSRFAIRRRADLIVPLGALGFVVGVVLAARQARALGLRSVQHSISLWIIGAGLVVMFVGVLLRLRREDRAWELVPAKCTDRELKSMYLAKSQRRGWHWFWRIVCEFDYNGARNRVTPSVYWVSFASEEAARQFLDQHVSPAGDCRLHVNPENPLQTELFTQGIKER